MVGELGTFWWLGQLVQVWVKYGRSGEMYWGVGEVREGVLGVWEVCWGVGKYGVVWEWG